MVDFTSGESMRTSGNITAFSGIGVIGFAFRATATQGILLATLKWQIYLSANKLYFTKYGSLDDGVWSCPVSINTNYQCAIMYNHNADDTADPTIYLNGVSQTVTEEAIPEDLYSDAAGILYVGGNVSFANPLQGYIGDVWLYQGSLTAAQLVRATTNRLHGYALQFGTNILHNFWMNEFPDGGLIATANTILPNGNVATPWTTNCSYTYINASDNSRAAAGPADDNEEFQFDYGTFTIPNGETVIGFKMSVEGYGTSLAVKYKRGGDAAFTLLGNTIEYGSEVTQDFRSFQALTQTQIDGFQGGLLTPTMDSDDNVYVDYVPVVVYSSKYVCWDRKGMSLKLQGFVGTGKASPWMTYA